MRQYGWLSWRQLGFLLPVHCAASHLSLSLSLSLSVSPVTRLYACRLLITSFCLSDSFIHPPEPLLFHRPFVPWSASATILTSPVSHPSAAAAHTCLEFNHITMTDFRSCVSVESYVLFCLFVDRSVASRSRLGSTTGHVPCSQS